MAREILRKMRRQQDVSGVLFQIVIRMKHCYVPWTFVGFVLRLARFESDSNQSAALIGPCVDLEFRTSAALKLSPW